ncbi:hypothetical protein WR25_19693 [Diploscapter pachys]|uniref:Strictosidine synthase conserved region domain-containing protein n=1 Tax=Diploscapter pachys TaxID=2018661 RepID=A0A2A2JVD6_9BILA|nr:hypothetical protein WR25_19693 [Diploscapter pachys]
MKKTKIDEKDKKKLIERLKSEGKINKPDPSTLHGVPLWGWYVGAVIASLLIALTLTFYVVPSKIQAVSFRLPDPIPLTGVLKENNRLTDAELLLENQIFGPECIAVDKQKGFVYTALKTGYICEIDIKQKPAKIIRSVRLNKLEECDGTYSSMPKCGRPLALRFAETGELFVLDAYNGLYMLNFAAEKVSHLLLGGAEITNDETAAPIRYLNDFDFLPDGRIVISEASNKFDDRDHLYELFEHRPNGRLLAFDPKKEELKVLLNDLYFPNGIQVIKGKVYFSELGMARIIKYSPSSGKSEVVIDALPGYPDNIRLASDGNLWVPLPARRSTKDHYIEEHPALREFMTKAI